MYCTRIMQLFVSHGSCRLQFEKISTFEPLIYILLFLYILSAEDYNLKCLCWKGVTLISGRDLWGVICDKIHVICGKISF